LKKNRQNCWPKKLKELGMEVLMEIHNEEELEKLNDFVDIVGVSTTAT
jgi:indole-3-glycerol phosphate synthase